MTPTVQSSTMFPVTLREWERLLTKALLQAEDGNADPIRSFEITPERLAFFCGHGVERAEEAEKAFRCALVSDHYLTWCLKNGTFRTPSSEVPECMAMLALSLLVDSLLEGDYGGTGEYRAKLRQWLGVDRSFMMLRGIATMWMELVTWLDKRVADGAPFRRLILPEIPATWTHIGYTRYLSYPTKRDLRFLERQIRRNPRLANDPAGLLRLLDPQMGSAGVSFGLRMAFADFRTSLRSGYASVDHRFWKLVGQARSAAGEATAQLADLRMEFDEDGRRQYRLSCQGASPAHPRDIGAASSSPALLESPNLGPAVRRGVLVFQSSGLASWAASGEQLVGMGPFHVAVADRHHRLARGAVAEFIPSGTWSVTASAVSSATVTDIMSRLGIRNAQENLRTVGFVGGVHVGACWLGAPRLLPRIEGASATVEVRRTDGVGGPVPTCAGGLLSADAPVEGQFLFSDSVGGWSRRATFVPLADVHTELSGASFGLPLHSEWMPSRGADTVTADMSELGWDERPYQYQDVLEGLYACGRSGLGEADAIALIDRVAGRRSWDVLRTLVEATFLDERLRLRWRGRIFTLGLPRLDRVAVGRSRGVVVSGAMPARLQADFHATVKLHGGAPFRRFGAELAPPVIGAVDVDAIALAKALGWSVSEPAPSLDGTIANRLPETTVVGDSYLIASSWDWQLDRFRLGENVDAGVRLSRMIHPAGRDHDLYRVSGFQVRTFTSRQAAIVDAYRQAAVPLFRFSDGEIHRIAREGALPIEVSRSLRLRTLVNGGGTTEGWSYRVGRRDEPWLASLMPMLIEGISATRCVAAIGDHRRGRGSRRAMWIDGSISA